MSGTSSPDKPLPGDPTVARSPSLASRISGPRPLSLTGGGGGSVAARVLQRASRAVRNHEAQQAHSHSPPQPIQTSPSPSPPEQREQRPAPMRSVSSPSATHPTPHPELARRASEASPVARRDTLPPGAGAPHRPQPQYPIAAQHASQRVHSPLPSVPEKSGRLPSPQAVAVPLSPEVTGSGTSEREAPPAPPPPPPHAPAIDVPPGVVLHPEFGREGDVMVLCNSDNGRVGFMINSTPLARASATFATALAMLPLTSGTPIITVSEPPGEMALLLLALVHGAVGAPRASAHAPCVPEYLTLLSLYEKYAVRPFFRHMLVHRIVERGLELATPLSNPRTAAPEIAPYLRLAAACRSARMWEHALRHARSWRHAVNPWRMDEEGVDALGEDAFGVLLALEALKGSAGEGGYSELRVTYAADGRASVWRVREPQAVFLVEDFARPGEPREAC